MTDQNFNSEKDTAYIQSLLDRLRATLGEEDNGDEGSNPSPTYDTPRTQTAPVVEPVEPDFPEDEEPKVPPVTPENDPLPVEDVPPAIFPTPEEEKEPVKTEEIPRHHPDEEGADPIPGEVPPATYEPMPEVDPFAPVEVVEEHPTELPAETPLVAEPAEFPRYEAEEDVEDLVSTESLDSVASSEPEAVEEQTAISNDGEDVEVEPSQDETEYPEDLVTPAAQEAEIREAEERFATILHKREEPEIVPAQTTERPWQSRRIDGAGTAAHPVGARYRSFPVPDATVAIPIIPIMNEGDLSLVDPLETQAPEPSAVETSVNEAEITMPEQVEQPVIPTLPIVEPATYVDAGTDDFIPEGHLATLPPDEMLEAEEETGEETREEPKAPQLVEEPVEEPVPSVTEEEDEETIEPVEAPVFKERKPFKQVLKEYLSNLFASKGAKSKLASGFPFGVSTIAHAPTEEGKKVRRNQLAQELLSDRIRCWISLGLLLLLFVWEMLPGQMNTLLSRLLLTRVPGAAILIDLQLLLLLCFVGYRPILRGFAAFGKGQVLPESLTSVGVVVAVGAQVALYLLDRIVPFTVGFMAGCLVVAAVVADYFRNGTLVCAMRVYSQSDEGAYIAAFDKTDEKHEMRAHLVSAPVDFAKRNTARFENTTINLTTIIVAFVAAMVYFFVFFGARGQFNPLFLDRAIWGAATVFCATMPISLFAIHGVLFGILSQRVAAERIGISDEETAAQYATVDQMVFNDTDAFPTGSVRVRGIKLRGDFRMDNALYLVSSLFRRVGGPLAQVFGLSTTGVTLSDDVEIRSIDEDGIEARINGEDLCVGSKEYLRRLGISVYNDPDDQRAIEENNAILCVAYRTQMCAKFYIRYTVSTAFESNVEYYAKRGVSTVLLTADPMLTPAFFDAISYVSDSQLTLARRKVEETGEEQAQALEGGLISVGPRKTLRRMPFFFRIWRACRSGLHLISCAAVIINAVAIPLLMLTAKSDAAMVTPLVGALAQLIWLLPTVITALVVGRMNPNKPQVDTTT